MKSTKIIFWLTTGLIFLFEGVMPAFFSQTKESKDAFAHLGYPEYFSIILTVFKVLGAIALILPMVTARIKEWAYAGFAIDFICACISYLVVDGVGMFALIPLIALAILIVSYSYYHKMMINK